MSIIEGTNICRSFKTIGHGQNEGQIDILKGVHIQAEVGTFNILMGPSGSGKTTLLNILGVLDQPTSGKLLIAGQEVTAMSEAKRDRVRRTELGYVFQSVALVSNMTAFQNIDFALRICNYSPKERRMRVEECLEFVDLSKRMKHYPLELSGGEQQRVAIARAIAHKPKILLADEPTAELDTQTGLKVVKLFKELVQKEKMTVLMCTHDAAMLEIADCKNFMEDGVLSYGK